MYSFPTVLMTMTGLVVLVNTDISILTRLKGIFWTGFGEKSV